MNDELPHARVRRKLHRCPACGGKPDAYTYEPDGEQVAWGYPRRYRSCRVCMAPLLEVGRGHCVKDWIIRESKAPLEARP